jgi:signal transduction histidine kinase/CheY-like chemotaxis protein
MVGRPITTIIPPDRLDEEPRILARIRAGERVDHFETVRQRKDGRLIDVSVTISPIRGPTGRIVGASKVARDVTLQKRFNDELRAAKDAAERAREEAERVSRMKDEFLATLGHELRTPLNAILGWAQLIKVGGATPEEVAEAVATIERNARVQTQLVEDLLDMSRIISGKIRLDVQRVDVAGVIEAAVAAVRPAAEAKGVRLQVTLDPLAGPVRGDANRLQQVVWNLLSNAVKFTPRGGRVQVSLERVNSHLEVIVSDTGHGIAPEFLPHVFDRFRQADAGAARRHGGLGLGLSIVKQLAELHGGSVWAKSPGEGRGATFTVVLPLMVLHDDDADDAAAGRRVHPRTSAGDDDPCGPGGLSLAGVGVLVVDDEPDARDLVRRILERCEARVVTAASAAEAVDAVRAGDVDVMLSDIGMPGEDGYALIRRVRALPGAAGRTPAVALTAFARSEDRRRALLAGYQIHLAKPMEAAELIAVVASLAGRTGGGPADRARAPS